MSGLQNKNLMFYSTHPNDKLSKMCFAELDKMPSLKKQFIPICIHDPNDITKPSPIRLPPIVDKCKKRGLIPILAIAGFNEPILASAALSWIKESVLKLDEGVCPSNIHGGGIADNCSTITGASMSGNTLFDTDYNIGFSNAKGEFNKGYANIDEAASSRIVTYDEIDDRKSASNAIAQRLEQLKFSRDAEVPQPVQRMGGMNGMNGMGGQPNYNMPSMPSMPSMPPMGGGGYGNMPAMPPMGGGYGNMPAMPSMPPMGGGGYGMPAMPTMPQIPSHKKSRKHR